MQSLQWYDLFGPHCDDPDGTQFMTRESQHVYKHKSSINTDLPLKIAVFLPKLVMQQIVTLRNVVKNVGTSADLLSKTRNDDVNLFGNLRQYFADVSDALRHG